MTKAELGQYISLKRETASLWRRIEKLANKDVPVVAGKVIASDKDFPWTQYRVSVQMYEPKKNDSINRYIDMLTNRAEQCEKKLLEIEQYIDGIEDSELRSIFQMRYIDGLKLSDISDKLGIDRSGVGKKITGYIKG